MAYKKIFNPLAKKGLDYVVKDAITTEGGILTGDLVFPVTGFLMVDGTGQYYRITINAGALVIEAVDYVPNGILTQLNEYLITEAGDYLIQE